MPKVGRTEDKVNPPERRLSGALKKAVATKPRTSIAFMTTPASDLSDEALIGAGGQGRRKQVVV